MIIKNVNKMINKKICFGMIFLVITLIQLIFISAISINIDMKESFSAGEKISFDYTITSTSSQDIEYLSAVYCPDAPLSLLDIKTTTLQANVPIEETYVYMSELSEDIEPQTCDAGVAVLSPIEITEETSFEIITNSSFEFNVLICKDIGCREQTKVFVKRDVVYLDYTSEISDLDVTVILISPNKNSQSLILPTQIVLQQLGNYELQITASKQDYKTVTREIQLGVIAESADIVSGFQSGRGRSVGNYMLFVMIGIVFILVVVIFIKLFIGLKKQRMRKGKVSVGRQLKKGFQKKERIIKKKERMLLRRLFCRKRKLPRGKKQEIDKKVKQEKEVLTKQKVEAKKEFAKKLGKEKKELQKKEKRTRGQGKKSEIRRLLTKGRRQLSNGNRFGAKNTYRKIWRIHSSLKKGEKNRDLYNELLTFHERLLKGKESKKKS